MKVKLPVQLKKVASRADRTYDLVLNTRELHGSDAAELLGDLMSEGWMVYSSNDDITEVDIPKEKAVYEDGGKTPSSRLRAVFYIFWKQRGEKGSFETYYREQMEKLIEGIKDRLE